MKYFFPFRFDERRGALWTGDREVGVTRKAADLLRCLVAQAGTVVCHDAILRAVWSGTHVQPENIKVLISELRHALGDPPRAPRFIRTEPGRGYTFVASVSEVPPASTQDLAEAVAVPFIDRRDHLSNLTDTLAAAARANSQMVLVEGDRGSGKTALCDRFLASLRRIPQVRVCYGQCVGHTVPAEPYAPVIDALEQLARQDPGTIAPLLARHAPTWLAQLPAWIREVACAPDRAAGAPHSSRMIREFSALIECLGADTSTVIVLDDLHWADLETIDLVRGVMRRHARLRTLVVAAYTPAEATLGAAALQGLAGELRLSSRCITVSLTPLDEIDVREYLRQRFGRGAVDALAPLVHALTGGTPLAVRSAVDALVAAEYLVPLRGGWHVRRTPSIIEASLPAGVVDVIAWRFDQLDAGDRAIVEFAAAVGVEFSAAEIARAAGADRAGVIAQRLDALQRRGFIRRVHDTSARGDRSHEPYRFLHESHADVLAMRAPAFQQVKAAERLAGAERCTIRRA